MRDRKRKTAFFDLRFRSRIRSGLRSISALFARNQAGECFTRIFNKKLTFSTPIFQSFHESALSRMDPVADSLDCFFWKAERSEVGRNRHPRFFYY